MASDQQLALSRSHHPLPSHVSKHSRQVVPAFLQKLYEMVNDPKNASLIRWSDDGESFFVLDHERFANQVLGRWFKHKNFSSFVRQLNMYGFHKIPHLQQGVLRSDSETEFWNFAHANFHRGQPDLLCFIQRKKQSSQQQMQIQQQADDVVAAAAAAGLVSDVNGNTLVGLGGTGTGVNGAAGPGTPSVAAGPLGASAAGSTGLTVLSNAQILDIHSIVQGIAAIKRHQATISVELSELKRSNELLWQDALIAREKHQKQEDTINRIVKFLAGVFGKQAEPASAGVGNGAHHGAGHHGGSDANPGSNGSVQRRGGGGGDHHQRGMRQGDGVGVVTRRRARLMIEDGRKQTRRVPPMGMHVGEVSEESDEDAMMSDSTMAMNQPVPVGGNPHSGMTLDTNDSMDYPTIESDIETPKSVNTPLPTSPAETVTNPHLHTALNSERALARTPPIFHGSQQGNSAHGESGDNSTFSFDPRNLMINLTPAQIQQLLTTLATQTPSGYEGGFLTSADGDENARREDASTLRAATPFDISSYLVPSPQLANLSLATGANGAPNSNAAPAASFSTPVASPTLSSISTPRAGGDGGAYVPVPDGLIAFDATDANGGTSKTARSSAAGTGTSTAGPADAAGAAYAGDLSLMRSQSPFMLPWPYQGYNGLSSSNPTNPGPATTGGGYANGSAAQGFAGFSFPSFGAGAEWSDPIGSGAAGGAEEAGGGGDYSGLFTPVLQNTATAGGATAAAATATATTTTTTTAGIGQTPNRNLSANDTSSPSAGSHDADLATLSSNWRATEDIDRDVDVLNTSIHNLIQTLGLDPTLMDTAAEGANAGAGAGAGADVGAGVGAGVGVDAGATGSGTGEGTGVGAGNVNGNGAETGRGRKNSVFDFEHFLSTWGLPGAEGASGGTAAGGVGAGMGATTSGIASVPPSDAATTASSSTPSGGSVDSLDMDGVDGMENGEDGVGGAASSLGFAPGKPVPARAPVQNQAPAQTRPTSCSGSTAMLVDEGGRPINKKARTSLTSSAPTSAGLPIATVEAGGRKRRSAIVGTGVDGRGGEGEGVDVVADVGQETGVAVGSQVQTRGAAKGVGTKAKKRRG